MGLNDYINTNAFKFLKNKLHSDTGTSNKNGISDLITSDINSAYKKRKYQGENYYRVRNDILNRTLTVKIDGREVEDSNRSNYRIPHNFHKKLVDQKTNYILGNPIKFSSKTNNKKSVEDIKNILTYKINTTLMNLCKEASNKADGWLYVYVDEEGMFKYTLIPSEQCIPIYDSKIGNKLIQFIRYYETNIVTKNGDRKTRYKVEIYDKDKITYYIQDENDNNIYNLDQEIAINPQLYFNIATNESQEINSWGEIPFIQFKNNEELMTDLEPIKLLIDSYDVCKSDFSNNLADIQDAVWVLKNYEGESLSEFMINLKTKKAINVGDNGGAESHTFEIPYESRESFLRQTRSDIYEMGKGVDNKDDRFNGAPSGESLKHLYADLDLKCDDIEIQFSESIKDLLKFIFKYLNMTSNKNYDINDIEIKFNRSMVSNEKDTIENISKSTGVLSKETQLANHPYVDDVEAELKRIEKEKEQALPEIPELNEDIKLDNKGDDINGDI